MIILLQQCCFSRYVFCLLMSIFISSETNSCIFLCCLLGMGSSSLSIHSCVQKTWSLFRGCFKAGGCQFLLRSPEETSLTPFIFLHLLRLGSWENPTHAWPDFSASCAAGWMDTFMWASFDPLPGSGQDPLSDPHLVLLRCGPGSCSLMVVKHLHVFLPPAPQSCLHLICYRLLQLFHWGGSEGRELPYSFRKSLQWSTTFSHWVDICWLFPMCQALCPFLAVCPAEH